MPIALSARTAFRPGTTGFSSSIGDGSTTSVNGIGTP